MRIKEAWTKKYRVKREENTEREKRKKNRELKPTPQQV